MVALSFLDLYHLNSGLQVRGFAPIGMVECWNIGHAVKLWRYNGSWDNAILDKWSAEGGTIKFKMDNIL
jgi:hypothetical protein